MAVWLNQNSAMEYGWMIKWIEFVMMAKHIQARVKTA